MSLDPLSAWAGPAQPAPHAFWADAAGAAWRVDAGGADLFLQRRTAPGAPGGPRHHVFRALAGQIFLGIDPALLPGGYALVAVPLPGTALRKADLGQLRAAAPSPELARLCEDWAQAIAHGMPKPPAPRQAALIARGETVELEDGILRGNEPVAWIDLRGAALWMDHPGSRLDAASGPFPLPRDLWLAARGLAARETGAEELLGDGRMWRALETHHRLVLEWLIAAAEQAQADERARLAAKAERSLSLRRRALGRLLSIAAHREQPAPPDPGADACLLACQALGKQQGILFRAPHAAEAALMARNPVEAIAAASGVRHRGVVLKGHWWREDNGPLLASLAKGSGWLALLPRGRGYVAFDPADGETRPVTEALAARLHSFAFMFYRALPPRPLGLRDLLAFALRGRGADLGLVLGLGLLGGLLGLATPIATGILVDTLIPSADLAGIWQMVGALAAAAVAASLFELCRAFAVLRIESKMDSELQSALWDRVLRLPVGFFRRYSAGDLALRINGINTIRRELSRSTVDALLGGLFSVSSYALLFGYSAPLTGLATVLVAAALLALLAIGYVKLRAERRISAADGALSSLVFQYLLGIVKLRTSAAESQAFANWAERFADYRRLQFQSQHWANVGHTLLAGYPTIAMAALFAAMAALNAEGQAHLATGDFIAFTAAFSAFLTGMLSLSETLLRVLNLVPLYERSKPILEAVPEADVGQAHPGELKGGIEVGKLSFRYGDGPPILKDVSFSVPPGSFVALVGPSGSGKSTLLRLLLGFEAPTAGTIHYDGQNLATLDVQALRRQIGVVLQSGQLIGGDIFTNIVGTSGLGLDDALEAARLVGLDEDLKQMPMGMHTMVAEGTNTLSGGQRQRILIARAIVHRPRILFLDEATSALDNHTQAVVTRSLDRLKSTRIVIAHRLSTIVNADKIIVLRQGEVAQVGDYASLIGQPGPFRELAQRQECL